MKTHVSQVHSTVHSVVRSLLAALVALTLAVPAVSSAQVIIPTDGAKEDSKRDSSRRRRSRRKPECPTGQERGKDTKGQCCWPGQAWNGDRCVGTPKSCPAGRVASDDLEACVPPGCQAGMVVVDVDHCCWSGQAWSSSEDRCLGKPECPAGFVVENEQCLDDRDKDGVLGEADRCPDEPEDGKGAADGCPEKDPQVTIAKVQEPAPSTVTPPPEDLPEEGDATMTIVGYVTAGVGLALVGGGVAMHFSAESTRDEVRNVALIEDLEGNSVRSGMTQSEAQSLQDDANSTDTLGAILTGVGAAAIAAGVTIIILEMTGSESESDVALGAYPLADGGACTLTVSF